MNLMETKTVEATLNFSDKKILDTNLKPIQD